MRNPLSQPRISSPYGPRGERMHWGVDMPAAVGTPVHAPESGYLFAVVDGDHIAPFRGYGPAAIMLRGNSGYYHLLGHLAGGTLAWPPAHKTLTQAQFFSSPADPHRACEGVTTPDSTIAPNDLERRWGVQCGQLMPVVKVSEGQLVGTVGAFVDEDGNLRKQVNSEGRVTWSGPHLHWEVRRKPLDKESAVDPLVWMSGALRSDGAPAPAGADDGELLLLAFAAFVLLDD